MEDKSYSKYLKEIKDDEGNVVASTPYEPVSLRAAEGNVVAMQIWAKLDKEKQIEEFMEKLLNGEA